MAGQQGDPAGGEILGEFAEFLKAKQAAAAKDDFAVNLKDAQGNEVTGIPISQAAGWLREKFGIGDAPEAGGGGDGEQGQGGAAGAAGVLKHFTGGKKAAGGGQQ